MLPLDGRRFATGAAQYYDEDSSRPADKAAIYVQIIIDDLRLNTLAILDTGSPWCIFDSEINDELGLSGNGDVALNTGYGKKYGSIERLPITIAAEYGVSLGLQASIYVCDDWSHGNFLGYGGLLQRFRFAIDPGLLSFYFGPS